MSATTEAAVADTGQDRLLKGLRAAQRWLLPALLILEFGIFASLSPYFLTAQNLTNVIVNSADLAFIAAGLTVVILMGGIDVSTGFAVGLLSWVIATAMAGGLPPVVVLVVALAAGTLLGLANGLLTSRLSIPSIVATLGTSAIFQTALFALWNRTDLFAGAVLPALSGASRIGPVPTLFVLVVLVYAALHFLLTSTRFGRAVYAIGSSVEAAKLAGININRTRLTGSLILGGLLGVAACTYLARVGVVQAQSGNELTLLSIAAVVVGGTSILGGEGSALRTLGGVLFITVLTNGIVLAGVPSLWNGVIIGCVIILAVSIDGLSTRLANRKRRML